MSLLTSLLGRGSGGASGSKLPSGLYVAIPGPSLTTSAMSLNAMRLMPFSIDRLVTLDRIGIEVTTGAASSTIRLGIYSEANGDPRSLVLDAGTVDSSTTGAKEITISQTVAPGSYWLAAVAQGGTPTVRDVNGLGLVGHSAAATATAFLVASRTKTGVSGALPNPVTGLGNGAASAPRVFVRAV